MGKSAKVASLGMITVVAAGLLVGGGAAAQAAPAPTVTGKALITYAKDCSNMATMIQPVSPAAYQGTRLGFPVTSLAGRAMTLGGSLSVTSASTSVSLTNPNISIGPKTAKTGAFRITVVDPSGKPKTFPLFAISRFTAKSVNAKTKQWTGVLQAPAKPPAIAAEVSGLLSLMCGHEVKPGDTVGSIAVTVTSS